MAGGRRNHSQLRKWKLRPDAAFATSRRSKRCVPTQFQKHPGNHQVSLFRFMYVMAQVHTFHWIEGYDCAGLRIRLRWVKDTTSLGDGFDFAGWKRQFRWLNKALDVAEWSGWCCRMKYLNEAVDVAEFSTISWLNFSMRFKNALKGQNLRKSS